jgi:hypothetical protein
MTEKTLEEKFSGLLSTEIKVIPKKITTLFDIAGFPHYETVISNFYAYYLDPSGKHGFGDLFISVLSNLIYSKTNKRIIQREVYTENRKYIDIVISESVKGENLAENAIIIENKIYAILYNDLNEYYNHIKVTNQKIGVVLSIRKENILPENFINITHQEFISSIEQSSGLYFLNIDPKHLTIFKEFLQNIKYMANSTDISEQYDFYFKHQEKIIDISTLYDNIIEDVFKQASSACEKLDLGLELRGNSNKLLRYYISKKASVYFTVWLADLMGGDHSVSIMVELDAEGMKHLEEINKIDFTEEEKALIKETTRVRKTYLHYAVKTSFPSPAQIKNLTDHIFSEIVNTPLKSIFLKIENMLSELELR